MRGAWAVAILRALVGSTAVIAQTPYPNRPIRFIVPGFSNPAWWGVVAPAGTPQAEAPD